MYCSSLVKADSVTGDSSLVVISEDFSGNSMGARCNLKLNLLSVIISRINLVITVRCSLGAHTRCCCRHDSWVILSKKTMSNYMLFNAAMPLNVAWCPMIHQGVSLARKRYSKVRQHLKLKRIIDMYCPISSNH
jgi:hypothetical protein